MFPPFDLLPILEHFHSRDQKGFIWTFRNGFALVKLFNAIPLPFFSAAVNCAPQHHFISFTLCSRVCFHLSCLKKVVLNTAQPTIGGCPPIVTLEERKDWLKLQCRFNHPQKSH